MLESKGRAATTAPSSLDTISRMEYAYGNEGFFGPVNGLIGFQSAGKYSSVCICNVSTREVSPWIESKLSVNVVEDQEKRPERTPYYEMGFDPATKKHKVIRIWRMVEFINNSCYSFACDVLTVGDNKWRRIELPPFELEVEDYRRKHTVYLNGFIYYCTSTFMEAGEIGNDKIVAFDVGAEKFRVITVPNFILNQPRDVYRDDASHSYLIELAGRIALLSRISDCTAKLWVFDGVHDGNKEKNTSMGSGSNHNWTEVALELPYLWSADRDICFHSVGGTDQIVIESYDDSNFTRHFYNWKTKSCKEIYISKLEYYPAISTVSTLVESLVHV
ncbi:hypothetical protein MKW92_049471 [Papaver armeniacum]|nr:hypothetical protein MKW92_049471 [Papaver armeniacum]